MLSNGYKCYQNLLALIGVHVFLKHGRLIYMITGIYNSIYITYISLHNQLHIFIFIIIEIYLPFKGQVKICYNIEMKLPVFLCFRIYCVNLYKA